MSSSALSALPLGGLPRAALSGTLSMAAVLLVCARAGLALPEHTASVSAVLFTGCVAAVLAHRSGGRAYVSLVVGLGLGTAAVVSGVPELAAGVALATAVLTGLAAMLLTVPAPSLLLTVREVLVATGLSAVGALAVAAYDPTVDPNRFRTLVVAAALVGAISLVSWLGAGLHGLGRRGALLFAVGMLLLVAAVAYGEAVSRLGTPGLVNLIESFRGFVLDHLNAVPHPIEALLGYPALAWGIFMRARRRQGWWVCLFGVVATASTAAALIDPAVGLTRAVLGSAYSLVLGLLIGLVVIRIDQFVSGSRGSQARRDEMATAHRPEPGRVRALR